jgi:hypothetical protein
MVVIEVGWVAVVGLLVHLVRSVVRRLDVRHARRRSRHVRRHGKVMWHSYAGRSMRLRRIEPPWTTITEHRFIVRLVLCIFHMRPGRCSAIWELETTLRRRKWGR